MDRIKHYLKYVILLALDLLPFVVRLVFWEHGRVLDLFVLCPCVIALMILNFFFIDSIAVFTAFQCLMAFCGKISGDIQTDLYCTYVSDDGMSRAIGDGFTQIELWVILLATFTMVVIKIVRKRKRQEQ